MAHRAGVKWYHPQKQATLEGDQTGGGEDSGRFRRRITTLSPRFLETSNAVNQADGYEDMELV